MSARYDLVLLKKFFHLLPRDLSVPPEKERLLCSGGTCQFGTLSVPELIDERMNK